MKRRRIVASSGPASRWQTDAQQIMPVYEDNNGTGPSLLNRESGRQTFSAGLNAAIVAGKGSGRGKTSN